MSENFIVGCGHSGNTLLQAILGSHSNIYAVPGEPRTGFKSKSNILKSVQKFREQAKSFNKRKWVEKTPKNILKIENILEVLPKAKFILMIRDGRDVAYSFMQRYKVPLELHKKHAKQDINTWINANLIGEAYWSHPNFYVVHYEDIIKNFENTISKVLNFLDEEFEQQLFNFQDIEKPYLSTQLSKYRIWQVNQPLFDGRGKWKNLTEEQKKYIENIAGEMLKRYGYKE